MILLPIQNKFSQLNTSDRFGSLWYTKNCNFDEAGYLTLSSRSFSLAAESTDGDLGIPVAFGRKDSGEFFVITAGGNLYNTDINNSSLSITDDNGGSVPDGTFNSHGRWWQNRWHASNQTTIRYKTTINWTNTSISLTTGKMHAMEVFRNRNTLCVTNGNIVQQYATDYSTTNPDGGTYAQLTLPADYEAIGLAYCNNQMGVITRLGNSTEGQNQDAYFFVWDGSTSEANGGFPIGSDSSVAITAYKSSWVVLTRTGQLLYFTGSSFEQIAAFPFYYQNVVHGDFLNRSMYGDTLHVEGDLIYINMFMDFSEYGSRMESIIVNNPSGIWCYDPSVGLYHRYSPSISPIALYPVLSSEIDSTDSTIDLGEEISTGTPVMYPNYSGQIVGGLNTGRIYYAINFSDTEIQLAETLDDALAGTEIDFTTSGTGSHYFYIPQILDYGATATQRSGGIAAMGVNSPLYDHLIFGGDYYEAFNDDDGANLCITVPEFPNTGYFVSPRVFSNNVTDINQKLYISFNPLKGTDTITVKFRNREIPGLPSSVPNNSGVSQSSKASWTSTTVFTTQSNLVEVKEAFDNLLTGESIDVEIIGGLGAGQSAFVTNIVESSGLYTVTVDTALDAIETNGLSLVVFSNWNLGSTITSLSPNNELGYAEVPIGTTSRFIQYKVEMKGVGIKIESLQIINNKNQESK